MPFLTQKTTPPPPVQAKEDGCPALITENIHLKVL
jgi:hypothetical protein